MKAKDTTYLKKRSDGPWLVQVAVPRPLRKLLERDIIEKSLRTQDHGIALQRRDEVVANIRDAFNRAKRGYWTEPDFAFIDLWQDLADAGFYRPSDGFTYCGQRYSFVGFDKDMSTWSSRCNKCERLFRFSSPGRFPPRKPRRSCICNVVSKRDLSMTKHRITFEEIEELAKAGKKAEARALLEKLRPQTRLEPDGCAFSTKGVAKFYRRGRRVGQDENGEWKLLSELKKPTARKKSKTKTKLTTKRKSRVRGIS